MSEITLPIWQTPRISNARVYDLPEAVVASKFPMATHPVTCTDVITETAMRLANSPAGSGHDNYLCGILVAFNISLTAKCLIELERYHFANIVSCTSTMHRITRFDPDQAYDEHVDPRAIDVMRSLIADYNDDPTPENYLKVLHTNPAGFIYTMRITTNYRQLKTIYAQRKAHRLPEWRGFCEWIETLPEAALITGDALHSTDLAERCETLQEEAE